jgi:hypothetical protein
MAAGDRERGRFDQGERPHQVRTACRGQKAEDTAIGLADQMYPAAHNGDEIINLGVEVETQRWRAIAVTAPIHQYDPVLVGQLPLLRKGLLGTVKAAMDEHDRLAPAELDNVQIGLHPRSQARSRSGARRIRSHPPAVSMPIRPTRFRR